MSELKAWLSSRRISSHAIAVAIFAVAGLIKSDQTVRDFLIKVFIHHPTIVSYIFSAAGIILLYRGAHSALGVIAEVPKAIVEIKREQANSAAAPLITPEAVAAIVSAAKEPAPKP